MHRCTHANLWTAVLVFFLNFAPRQITMWAVASTRGSFNRGLFFCCLKQVEEDLRNFSVIECTLCDVKVYLSILYLSSPLPPPPVSEDRVYLCQDFGPAVKK